VSDDLAPPVFLGGVAGTGKTRLGSLLGRHSRLSVTRKTYLWRDVYGRHGDLSEPGALDRCIAATLATPGVRALHLDRDAVLTRMSERRPTYANLFDVIHRLHAESLGKARWCDQLGLVEAYADPIFDAFPSARFIHMVGDPPRTVRRKRAPGASGWAVGKWLTSMELAERNARQHGDGYLVVRHEGLLADEEATLRDVCAFLGEEVEPSMLAGSPPPAPQPADPARLRFVERAADRIALTAWRRIGTRSIAKQIAAET
jgi:hypothetical protein